MAAKDSKRGKSLELTVGRIFGGRRRRNGEGVGFDDCITLDGSELPISIETKSYARLQLQTKWIEQAKRNAGKRPWMVVQRPRGWRRILVTLELDTLVDPTFHELIRQLTSTNHPKEGASEQQQKRRGDPIPS